MPGSLPPMDGQPRGSTTTHVGMIGLGIIGSAVAEQLLASGHTPVVHDLRPEPLARAQELGATVATSARAVAERCDTVLVCVQNDEQCHEVVEGPDGILAGARPGSTIAILSTIHPDTITQLAAAAAAHDVALVDAPMAGQGEASVRDGTLWVMAGGDDAVVARLRPTLEGFAGRVLHAGPLGSGAALKLAHNVMVYLGYLSVLEAVELARAAGVHDGLLAEVTRATGTLSPQSEIYLEIFERRRHDQGDGRETEYLRTSAAVLEKDLRIAVELAAAHGLALPGSALVAPRGLEVYRVGDAG